MAKPFWGWSFYFGDSGPPHLQNVNDYLIQMMRSYSHYSLGYLTCFFQHRFPHVRVQSTPDRIEVPQVGWATPGPTRDCRGDIGIITMAANW